LIDQHLQAGVQQSTKHTRAVPSRIHIRILQHSHLDHRNTEPPALVRQQRVAGDPTSVLGDLCECRAVTRVREMPIEPGHSASRRIARYKRPQPFDITGLASGADQHCAGHMLLTAGLSIDAIL
jgi:hypothetical protein